MRPSLAPNCPSRSSQEARERPAQLSHSLRSWRHIMCGWLGGLAATDGASRPAHDSDNGLRSLLIDQFEPLTDLLKGATALAPGWLLARDVIGNSQVNHARMDAFSELCEARRLVQAQGD